MRDNKGFETDFEGLIQNKQNANSIWLDKLKNGKTNPDKVNNLKRNITSNIIKICIAKYSYGYDIPLLIPDLLSAINLCNESWINNSWKLKLGKEQVFNQYILSAYDEMLWMLSLGFLLNIEDKDFKKLVEVIDRDEVSDFLFEKIIKAKLPDRSLIKEESYQEHFDIPRIFKKLREAISVSTNEEAVMLMKEFVRKDWFNNHKGTGWANSHKSSRSGYFGYWSFETAALTAILNLDDEGFRTCKYYPKDLVSFYKKNKLG